MSLAYQRTGDRVIIMTGAPDEAVKIAREKADAAFDLEETEIGASVSL